MRLKQPSVTMERAESFTDEELVACVRNGSEHHFDALVDRYSQTVYGLAFGISGNRHDAEDIVQETFVRVFQHIDQFEPSRGSFRSWLLTIARNQAINLFAKLRRNVGNFFSGKDPGEDEMLQARNSLWERPQGAEELLQTKQEFLRVTQAVDRLPERQKTALLLKAHDNMSYEEIAAVLKTSVSSVESLIFRARRKVMDIVEE